MALTIAHAKQTQKKSRRHTIRQIGPNWYKVVDGDSSREYDVNLGLNGGTCTCEWGRHRPEHDHRSGCSHVIAAINYRAIQHGRRVSVWASERAAQRQHRPIVEIGDGLIITSRVN